MRGAGEYKPISDYAVIGNLRTVALVGTDGSIDWCCLPHLEDPSVFGTVLDARRGSRFKVSLPGAHSRQRYEKDTNVLETRFHSDAGQLSLTDFMPLPGNITGTDGTMPLARYTVSSPARENASRWRSSGRPGSITAEAPSA